jgi:hypothetical protein
MLQLSPLLRSSQLLRQSGSSGCTVPSRLAWWGNNLADREDLIAAARRGRWISGRAPFTIVVSLKDTGAECASGLVGQGNCDETCLQ